MKSGKVIFLHSMFRAGSTYLFNKFRDEEKFWVFYEPLHHDLIRLRKESLDIFRYDINATNVMKHPELKKPHFFEFQNAFKNTKEILPYFDADFSYKEFFGVHKDSQLKNYIDNLIDSTLEQKIPVFQFNRTSLRIDWFKKNYHDGLNVFLIRNPRDQFESYYQRGPINNNIFLAINIYIVLNDNNAKKYLLPESTKFKFTKNVSEDLKNCMSFSEKLSLAKHYEIFYFIWFNSYLHAKKYADIVLDMDRLNHDIDYLKNIETKFHENTGAQFDFDDYKITQNDEFTLELSEKIKIEKKVATDCQSDFKNIDKNPSYKHGDLKKENNSLLKRVVSFFTNNK